MRVLVTGAAGLVGSECASHFARGGHEVAAVDNGSRSILLGDLAGDTRPNLERLRTAFPGVHPHEIDIRDEAGMKPLVAGADLVIHAAAQPSHPRSIEIPIEDFSINAAGTLALLELTRQFAPRAVFVYCSTNKVYGDRPNRIPRVELETRHDFANGGGIDESMPIDQCLHTPFGVSKAAADLYVQEYARLYGLATGIFRMGCIAGAAARAVESQNWEGWFVRCALEGRVLTIHGHAGKQVRDVVHARDLARLFETFARDPRPGAVYNIGGGRPNSVSLLEAIDLIQRLTGRELAHVFGPERPGDHVVYITELAKVRRELGWEPAITVREIFAEIHDRLRTRPS